MSYGVGPYGLTPFGRASEVQEDVSDTAEAILVGSSSLTVAAAVESGPITLSASASVKATPPYQEDSFHKLIRREAFEPNKLWLNWRVSPPNPNFYQDNSPRQISSNNYTTSMVYTANDHPNPHSKLGAYGWATRAGILRSTSTQVGIAEPSTVGCWIKTSSTDTTMFNLLDHDNGSGSGRDFKLMLGGSPKVAIFRKWFAGNTTTREVAGTTPLNDGQWHLVVGVYDGTHMRLYVDGVEEASLAVSGTPNTGGAYYHFGGSQYASENYGYQGLVTDIFIVNRAFDDLEAFRLYSRMTGAPEEWARQVDFDPLLLSRYEESTFIRRDPDGYPRSGSRKQRHFGPQTWRRSDRPDRLPQDIAGEAALSATSRFDVGFRPTWHEPFESKLLEDYKGPSRERWSGTALTYATNEAGGGETHIEWAGATTRAMVSRMQRVHDVDLQFDFWMLKNHETDSRQGITVMVGADPSQQGNYTYANVGYYFYWRWRDSTIDVYRRSPSSSLVASFPVPPELVAANNQWISVRWRARGGSHEIAFWKADEEQPDFQATFTDANPLPAGVVALSFYSGYTYDTYQWRLRNFWVYDPYVVAASRLFGHSSVAAISSEDNVEFGVANLSGGASLQATGRNVIGGSAVLAGEATALSGHEGTPNLIPDLGGWFLPHLDEAAVGSLVQKLRDYSPKRRDFLQGNSSRRPTLVGNVRNGLATLRFDGSNDAMQQQQHAAEPNAATYFAVLHKRDTTNGTWIFDGLPGLQRHQVRTYNHYAWLSAGTGLASDTIVWAEDFKVVTFKVDGASSAIRHMGELFGEGDAGTQGNEGLTLAARSDAASVAGTHLAADIAEFLVFNRALTEAEILQVEGYLAGKWALDLRSRASLSGGATLAAEGETLRISPRISMQTRSRLQSEHDFGLKPSQIGGLRLWVSASDLYLQWFNDEDRLTSWASREEGLLALTQGTLGFQPRYRQNVANNGRDAVRFQGAQFMRTALQSADAQPNTTFVVATVGGANQSLLDGAESSGAHRHAMFSDASGRVSIAAGESAIASNGKAPTPVELWTATFGYPEGSSIRRNAVPHATGDVGAHAWRGFTVGARFDGNSQYLNGDIVEILHFDRQLSELELEYVEGYLLRKHGLPESGGGTLSGRASIYARAAGEYLVGESSLTAVGSVIAHAQVESKGTAEVTADLGYRAEIAPDTVRGSSAVSGDLGVYMLSPLPIQGEAEVEAHLTYHPSMGLGGTAAGSSTPEVTLSGFMSVRVDPIAGSASFTSANLTYWKPLAPVTIEASSSLVGDFDIYTIPPQPIEGSSLVDADLAGKYGYVVDIFGSSSVYIEMEVETYFLPSTSDGFATVVGNEFTVAPRDISVDRIAGSTSFVSTGSGYLVLNLDRSLEALIAGSTAFEQAILGMPVVIGRFQADRAEGTSSVIANLFINEGGQANCNSRVEGIIMMLREISLAGETTGNLERDGDRPGFTYIDLPDIDYWRPAPPARVLEYVREQFDATEVSIQQFGGEPAIRLRASHVPCGAGFLWVDMWPRGDLEPQVAQGWTGVGTYHPGDSQGRVFVHPYGGQRWQRPAGYFVDSTGFNTLGLFARTSEVDDYYNRSQRVYSRTAQGTTVSSRTAFGDQVASEIEAGQLWHEQMLDDGARSELTFDGWIDNWARQGTPDGNFHGYCGTRFISTINGENSVDMHVELKNALYGAIVGVAEVVGNFIILRFRTMTVEGNVARKMDLDVSVEGGVAKSPANRLPFQRQPGRVARKLDKVRSGRTLYT